MELPERFIAETAEHVMTVLHEHDAYLHLRFANPDSPGYWFELITTPAAVIVRAEGESFVFGGMRSLRALYRHGRRGDGSLHFDPAYWASKLTSSPAAAKEYSQELFDAYAARLVRIAEDSRPGIEAAWQEFAYGASSEHNLEYEACAREALSAFYYGEYKRSVCTTCDSVVEYGPAPSPPEQWSREHEGLLHIRYTNTLLGFRFRDPETGVFDDYARRFLFACAAVMWGMDRYDRHAAAREAAPAEVDALSAKAVA